MKMPENAVEVSSVSKVFKLKRLYLTDIALIKKLKAKKRNKTKIALDNINLNIQKGEIVGLIGKNGSGKSTLLKVITGVMWPTTGFVNINGSIAAILELSSGLNQFFSGRENAIFLSSLMGVEKSRINDVVDRIQAFSELEDYFDLPVNVYSSGMKARLGFSIAINVDPDILIVDEVLSVGDRQFKKKCIKVMNDIFEQNKTIIIATHDLTLVRERCHRVLLMSRGQIIGDGNPELITDRYTSMD